MCAHACVFPNAHSGGTANGGLHFILDKVRRETAAVILPGIRGSHPIRGQKRFSVFGDGLAFQPLQSQPGRYRALS